MTETSIISTHVHVDAEDFDIRREFCGFQDKRLNDLRLFTSCIIDLQTHGKKDPFEKVTWIISHDDAAVRAFVVKRLQYWAQNTQIAAQIHKDDLSFRQGLLSDSSSSSIDAKVKSSPPSHDLPFSTVPSVALVPQARRRRNSSSSSSAIRRPALFGKPSDCQYTRHRYSPMPIKRSNTFAVRKDEEKENVDFEEEAKWANLLSDSSDFEDDSYPLMADTILISQLRECLVNAPLVSVSNVHSLLLPSLAFTSNEQTKQLNGQPIWIYRLILNSKIILADGIHRSREEAEALAYRKMIALITAPQGIEAKVIANGRCKVVLRKCLKEIATLLNCTTSE